MNKRYIDAERFAYRYKCLETVARNHLEGMDLSDPNYLKFKTQAEERKGVQDDIMVFTAEKVVADIEGEWKKVQKMDSYGLQQCSECGAYQFTKTRYCCNCGARMTNFVETKADDYD